MGPQHGTLYEETIGDGSLTQTLTLTLIVALTLTLMQILIPTLTLTLTLTLIITSVRNYFSLQSDSNGKTQLHPKGHPPLRGGQPSLSPSSESLWLEKNFKRSLIQPPTAHQHCSLPHTGGTPPGTVTPPLHGWKPQLQCKGALIFYHFLNSFSLPMNAMPG